jgi:hypothetical protein
VNAGSLLVRVPIVALLLLAARMLPGGASDPAVYLLLGVLPGLVITDLMLAGDPPLTRVAVALAVGPLAGACLGVGFMSAGVDLAHAARLLVWTAAIGWALAGSILPRRTDAAPATPAPPRAVTWVALGLAFAVALPPLLNPFIAIRGDSWTHGAIVIRILEGGIPPEDPRFAAIPLHYVWFYNLFVALLASLRDRPPFAFMVCLNVATAFATVVLTALAALRVWRRREAAIGAAMLVVFGLNAGAWLLVPARLARVFIGDVRGVPALVREVQGLELGWARVIYSLSAPFAHMVSFLDKLLVGSPLAYGYLIMILHLWALLGWLERGRRSDLVWLAGAAGGMMLIHGVVALSVIPVWLGVLLLAALLRSRLPWLPSTGRLLAAAAATLAGGLVTTPYMISVASGWSASQSGVRHQFISPDPLMAWTLATACAFGLWFARRPLIAAFREQVAAAGMVGLYLVAMIAFSLIVRLPENNQTKFVFQAFVPALLLAAPGFWAWVGDFWRHGPSRAALILGLIFVLPGALTLHGYIADRGRTLDRTMREDAPEAAMNRWIREGTPHNSIVVDRGFRDLLLVRGRRPAYLGTDKGPEWAAFPLAQIVERRRVVADLYGPAADVGGDADAMARLGRPIYVVFRPEDDSLTVRAWKVVRETRARFEPAYDRDGYRVVRVIARGSGA